jgi:hypothetical protein
MALPKLNDAPKYSVQVPSLQKTIRFRPFLVKEEKVLLLAMESENTDDILLAILDTVQACIADDVDVKKLTTYDVEYLFTQIRAKSVGETTKVGVNCQSCNEANEVVINIDSIEVKGLEGIEYSIQLSPDMQLQLSHPAYYTLFEDDDVKTDDPIESIFAMVRLSLDKLKTEDDIIDLKNESKENLDEFVGSMNTDQFQQVREFVENMPAMQYDVEFDCVCGHHNKHELRGIQSFF